MVVGYREGVVRSRKEVVVCGSYWLKKGEGRESRVKNVEVANCEWQLDNLVTLENEGR